MPANFSSVSPVDGCVLWQGDETSAIEIEETMIRAAGAVRQWRRTPLQTRIEIACRYREQLKTDRQQIERIIVQEIGKLRWEAAGEINSSIAKIDLSIEALAQRRSETLLDQEQSGRIAVQRRVRHQPLGVTLVLGPFNFPLHLPGGQIIPALLAGNTVVFKPSEQATAIGHWMVNAWRAAGLPEDVLQPIVGGPEVATRAIDSPQLAAVLLTGSRAAGHAIHRRLAGRPNVLVALELGGNNPMVIADGVPAQVAAAIVSASAFVTAGQRCTCARRAIFVESESTAGQLRQLVLRTRGLRVGMPDDSPPPDIGPLISNAAAAQLLASYDKLLELGCQPLIAPDTDPRAGNLVRPSIVDATNLSSARLAELGRLEWFGPLLVVQRVADFQAAVEAAANTPYGLAAALLGGTREMFDQFVTEVGAGVANWNGTTTGAAGKLPFGGLGDSGNHRPAGYYAIDFCSDPVASLERTEPPSDDPWNIR